MTNQEALEVLKIYNEKCSGCDKLCDDMCKPAVELAISALEKQIQKKPVMRPFSKDMEDEYLCCPTCGDILTDAIPSRNKDFYYHCMTCGQKFLWEGNRE